ncbi:uncharacterized protein [Onthophagus taurus]|uniref:uncharacterized protein n=1 Tax=Onthophagus taurus TaxID=166361 RepID=UPI000C203316|nr:uncharacterized protein LOC111425337 [Onthophagus taurus]
MANIFVKWWKNKFLNSYKQFADASYGKVSDTEELLGAVRHDSDIDDQLRVSCTTPPCDNKPEPSPGTSSPYRCPSCPRQTNRKLNFEQFSCDVSLEDGIDKSGQQRQEFSFTLYDFDGYGKITKDDIAGLVTTIYEALGSSVKVPHYGSKTIRVKLTVSPDQRKHVSATLVNCPKPDDDAIKPEIIIPEEPPKPLQPEKSCNVKKNHHRTRTSGLKKRTCRRHRCCEILANRQAKEQTESVNVSDDASEFSATGDNTSEEDRDCSEYQYTCGRNNTKEGKKGSKKVDGKKEISENIEKNDNKQKLRSSSLQRKELLEIIQANMNKNNLEEGTTRNHTTTESQNTNTRHLKTTSKSKRHPKKAVPTLQYLANIMDPAHFYVDLASFHNATQLTNSNIQYDKLIDAVMCVSNKRVPVRKVQVCRKHAAVCSNSNQGNDKPQKRSKLSESEYKTFRKHTKKIPQIVLGTTSAPHYLRHRNRQEDQARAMAQVVRWLEREFSSNFYTNEDGQKKKNNAASSKDGASPTETPTQGSSVERHEHYHVHEHIHHHYHHYEETPIVV